MIRMHTKLLVKLLVLTVFKPRRKVKESVRRVVPKAKKFTYISANPNRIHLLIYATTSIEITCSELSFIVSTYTSRTLCAVNGVESVSVVVADRSTGGAS